MGRPVTKKACPIAPHALRIVNHMNVDHADSLIAYVLHYNGEYEREEIASVKMLDIDQVKITLEVEVEGEAEKDIVEIKLLSKLKTAADARKVLVAMAEKAAAAVGMEVKKDGGSHPHGHGRSVAPWGVNPLAGAGVLFGMLVLYLAAFGDPPLDGWVVPFEQIGLFVFRSHSNMRAVFWLAWLAHAGEAAVAWRAATKAGFTPAHKALWSAQCFVFGYPSLGRLLALVGNGRKKAA